MAINDKIRFNGRLVVAHSVKHNAVMNMLLVGSNTLVTLVTVPYVSRVLSVEGNGAVSLAQNSAAWFLTFCVIGVPAYAVRECSRARDDREHLSKLTFELLSIIALCTVVSLIVFAFAIFVVPSFKNNSFLMWVFWINTLISAFGVEWIYQATEQYDYIVIRSVIFKILTLVCVLLFVRTSNDFLLYGMILAAGTCGNNVFNLLRLRTLISIPQNFSLKRLNLIQHVKPLGSFTLMSVVTSMYTSFDTVLLSSLSGNNYQTGLYQLASKLKAFLVTAATAAINVLVPRLSYYSKTNNEDTEYRALLKKSFSFVLFLGLVMACILWVFAKPIVIIVSSAKFIEAIPSVRIIGLVILTVAMSNVLGLLILVPSDKEGFFAIACTVAMPVSVVLNVLLDPWIGALGASLALLFAELTSFLMQVYFCRHTLRCIIDIADVFKTFFITCFASIAAFFSMSFFHQNVIEQFFVGIPIFGVILLISGFLLRQSSVRYICSTLSRYQTFFISKFRK